MRNLFFFLVGFAILLTLSALFLVYEKPTQLFGLTTYLTVQGGTGTTSPSGILYGDDGATSHLNTVSIGSNLTFAGGVLSASSGGGSVATSTPDVPGQVTFFTSTDATPATIGGSSTFTYNQGTSAVTVDSLVVTGGDIHIPPQNGGTTNLIIKGSDELSPTGDGGDISIITGTTPTSGNGGDFRIRTGAGAGGGTAGLIQIDSTGVGAYADLNTSALNAERIYSFPDTDGTFVLGTGSAGNCAQWSTTNLLGNTGAPCPPGSPIATSTNETAGNLAYWTSSSASPALLGQVATTSITCDGGATCTGFTALGAASTIRATFPFTIDTNFGALTNSTSTKVWFKNGLQASSTSQFVSLNYSGNLTGLLTTASTTYSTLQHYFNTLSPGQWTGGTIAGSGSNASVTSGAGFIKATDSNVADLLFTDWAGTSTVAFPSATSTLYLGVEYNSGTPRIVKKTTDTWDLDTEFPLGAAFRETGTVYSFNAPWNTGDAMANVIERFDSLATCLRDNRIGGLILSGSGTQNVAVTAGSILCRLSEFALSALDTSSSGSFDSYYRNGSGGFTKIAANTTWNNTQYDDGSGTLATVSLLRYTSRWFYATTDGSIVMVFGQNNDSQLATALNDAPPSSVPDRVGKGGLLIGRLIIQKSATSPSVTQSAFGTSFTAASVVSHTDLTNLAWTSSGHTGTANRLPYFNSAGAAAEVATSSLTVSGPFSLAGLLGGLVGGANSTLTYYGLATTSNMVAGQLLMANSLSGVSTVATTSVTCSGFLTCTGFNALGAASTITTTGTLTTGSGGTNHGNYTAGSVIFAGAAGTSLTEDNSNFFFDDTLNALGIGTSTPRFSLNIASTTGPQIGLSDGLNGSAPFTLRAIGKMFYLATSSPTTFATTTTPILTIDTTVATSSLGIGTTTFSGQLGIGAPVQNGTSTIAAGRIQIDGYSASGSRVCSYIVGTSWVIAAGACNQ